MTKIDGRSYVEAMRQLDESLRRLRTDCIDLAILSKTAAAAARGEFEPFKTSSIFDGTAQNPAWLGGEPERLQNLMP